MLLRKIQRPLWVLVLLMAPLAATAQKKALSIEDYPEWKSITGTSLSDDGKWMRYTLRPNEGDDTMYVKSLVSDKIYTVPVGASGGGGGGFGGFGGGGQSAFNATTTHTAYVVRLPGKEQEKLRAARRPITTKVQILDLATGSKRTYDNATSSSFSNDGKFVLVRKARVGEGTPTHSGTDAILRNLSTGVDMNLGNVSDAAFNRKSTHLAITVDAADKAGNGVYLVNLANGNMTALDTDTLRYSQMAWDDAGLPEAEAMTKGTGIAFLKGHNADTLTYRDNKLVVARGIGTPRQSLSTLDPASMSGFPKGQVISENGSVDFGSSGNVVFFGTRWQENKPKKNDDPQANLDVWHWKDERIQSVQMRQLNADRNYTYRSMYAPDQNRFLAMGDDSMRSVNPTKGDKYALGTKGRHYLKDTNWGMSFNDWYAIDLATGAKRKIATEVARPLGTSPDGTKLIYFKDKQIMMVEVATGKTTNLSANSPVNFEDTDNDYPYVKPPFGVAGWTKDGKGLLVYDKFDIWRLELDGSKATNITGGTGQKEQITFRYETLDNSEEWIDTSKPMLLSAYGNWDKKNGYYTMQPGAAPKPLYYVDMMVGNPTKAKNADVVILTQQKFEMFPDYYATNSSFSSPKKLTDANPQINEYAWGRRVLVDYKNRNGVPLQATLALPGNYEPGKKYPMIVYFYDRMSQRHHQFSMPTYDDRPHMSTYASNGYLVLMPDIVYGVGDPGNDALDAITAAVNATIEAGYADPAHIGLQGHSWGGYQSSYILTQTDLFACVVTGAPPTNLESFYNSLYKSSGTVQHGIMEVGQVRLGATPWEDPEMYRRLSPVHQVTKITTPFMILHGTADGAVDWMQGLELYNAARRNGKEVIFLSYPDEPHHLAIKANQIDFQKRMKSYFDHYLKGTPSPKWMEEGIPHINKGKAEE